MGFAQTQEIDHLILRPIDQVEVVIVLNRDFGVNVKLEARAQPQPTVYPLRTVNTDDATPTQVDTKNSNFNYEKYKEMVLTHHEPLLNKAYRDSKNVRLNLKKRWDDKDLFEILPSDSQTSNCD